MSDDSTGPGILVDLDSSSPVTVVAFGGLVTGRPIQFQFFRFLSGLDVRRVILRDHEQAWYQLGVRGVASNVDDLGAYLLDLLGEDAMRHAVFTGGSMGGYVAMLLGSRLGVAEVQAFAPQTFISRVLRRYYRDYRWQQQINHTWASIDRRRAYLDIKPSMRRSSRHRPVPIHIHVGGMERDLRHVTRVRRIPGISVHRYNELVTHNVAGELHDSGRLRPLFDEAVSRAERAGRPPGN
jgi:hypothetical protein